MSEPHPRPTQELIDHGEDRIRLQPRTVKVWPPRVAVEGETSKAALLADLKALREAYARSNEYVVYVGTFVAELDALIRRHDPEGGR